MHFWLLTHQNERQRPTNTGRLVSPATVITWQRKHPDPRLLAQIEQGNIALVYPSDAQASLQGKIEHFVLIDATWQEARKIYNHSPYLHNLAHVSLTGTSAYRLRRNQRGLCTAEAAASILQTTGHPQQADQLTERLMAWQDRISGQSHHGN